MAAELFINGANIYVDHAGTDTSVLYVGGQANAQLAAGVSHENSTDEGSLSQYAIPANSLVNGSTIRFWAAGVVEDNNGSNTLTIAVRLGTSTTVTSNVAVFSTGAIDVADSDIYCLHGIIQVRTAGSNGTAVAMMSYQDPDATGTAPKWNYKDPFTLDTTSKLYLDITGDWSAAHADNECNSEMFVVDIVNPVA
jgi:hypothetical protein